MKFPYKQDIKSGKVEIKQFHGDTYLWEGKIQWFSDDDSTLDLYRPALELASGKVLLVGLGLGCLLRGLLDSDRIDTIDVVELNSRIIGLVGPEFKNHKVRIYNIDWEHFTNPGPWDWAIHDPWDHAPTPQEADMLFQHFKDRANHQAALGNEEPTIFED